MTTFSKTSPVTSKSHWLRIFRWGFAIIVGLAILYMGWKTSTQLHTSQFDFRNVQWAWCAAAIASYIVAMILSWLFWHRVLMALGQQAPPGTTMLAFFASQLGKYVPGKAMVVVIRTDMIRGQRTIEPDLAGNQNADSADNEVERTTCRVQPNAVQVGPAAASVFVETLTWLFVGSGIGCLLLMFKYRDQTWLLVAAAIMTLLVGALTAPPVFRRIAKRLGAAKGIRDDSTADQVLAGLGWTTMIFGWFVMSIGWCFNGLSLWFVLYAIGAENITLNDYPLSLTCVCLATVAGFISLLPGGVGVRELVMIPLLGARFGSVTAVIAAIFIRLVWLAAELGTSAIIYLWLRSRQLE